MVALLASATTSDDGSDPAHATTPKAITGTTKYPAAFIIPLTFRCM